MLLSFLYWKMIFWGRERFWVKDFVLNCYWFPLVSYFLSKSDCELGVIGNQIGHGNVLYWELRYISRWQSTITKHPFIQHFMPSSVVVFNLMNNERDRQSSSLTSLQATSPHHLSWAPLLPLFGEHLCYRGVAHYPAQVSYHVEFRRWGQEVVAWYGIWYGISSCLLKSPASLGEDVPVDNQVPDDGGQDDLLPDLTS